MYDLIILGGGSAGVGVALASLQNGFKTVLLEKNRLMEATSNNTLRIIHGGFRYLQSFDFPRVIESIHDQAWLLSEFPDFIKPLPCVMQLKAFGMKSRIPVWCASKMFSVLAAVYSGKLPGPKILSRQEAEEVGMLRVKHGALLWHDAHILDPLGLRDALKKRIAENGIEIKEGQEVTGIQRTSGGFGVTTNTETFQTRYLVNTLGPNVCRFNSLSPTFLKPSWCLGFNLEFKINPVWNPEYALSSESKAGNLLFAVPRGTGLAIGTWYEPAKEPNVLVSDALIARALGEIQQAFPELEISQKDISRIDSGILPMKNQDSGVPELYAGEIVESDRGYVQVVSTKYTTFLSQGHKAMKRILLEKSHQRFP